MAVAAVVISHLDLMQIGIGPVQPAIFEVNDDIIWPDKSWRHYGDYALAVQGTASYFRDFTPLCPKNVPAWNEGSVLYVSEFYLKLITKLHPYLATVHTHQPNYSPTYIRSYTHLRSCT